MKDEHILQFRYRRTSFGAIMIVVMAFALTGVLGTLAVATPDALFPQTPALVFWALTAASLLASLFTAKTVLSGAAASTLVALRPEGAVLPKASLSMASITVPYDAIQRLQILRVGNHQLAVITSPRGECRLFSKSFASPGHFTAFLLALEQLRRQEHHASQKAEPSPSAPPTEA